MCSKISKVAIYGRVIHEEFYPYFKQMLRDLNEREVCLTCYKPFYDFLKEKCGISDVFQAFYEDDVDQDTDVLFSVGGDGTFLKTASLVGNKEIPILGINTGRLGFLADISPDQMEETFDEIYQGMYLAEPRRVLKLTCNGQVLKGYPYGLNEIAILKRDSSSMITIRAYINGELLNVYQADGLIVATPTGSTGYSLSVGGPILVPQSGTISLTPVAPHSLNVRPIVIRDEWEVTLEVESRSHNFLIAIDGRSETFREGTRLTIRRGEYFIRIVKRCHHSFFNTLREKMMWGADSRN